MRIRVEKCLGGLAMIVPKALATQAGLSDGGSAELEFVAGRLVVHSAPPATLAERIAGITPENRHAAWENEPPVGQELRPFSMAEPRPAGRSRAGGSPVDH